MEKETSPLLKEEVSEKGKEEHEFRVRQPRFKYVIEPILFLVVVTGFPRIILDPLLALQLMAKEVIGNRTDINISDLSTKGGCNVNTSDPLNNIRETVQEKAANFMIYQSVANFIPSAIVCLYLGAYSDKAGRKYALVPPEACAGLCIVVYICVIYFELSAYWLLLGNLIEGVGGRYQVLLMGVFSYIADTTKPEHRMFRIVVVEMLMFSCGIFAFVGIGVWVQTMGFLYPYLFILGGKILSVSAFIFILPETVQKDPNAKFFSSEHLKAMYHTFVNKTKPTRNVLLAFLLVAVFLNLIITIGNTVDSLFETNAPLCWSSSQIGYYTAAYIATIAVGGIVSSRLLKICLPDYWIALVAGLSQVISTTYKAFVTTSLMMYFVPALAVFGGVFVPTVRALMSNSVEAGEQGSVFGVIAFAEVIASFVGSTLFSTIYANTLRFMSGFVYLCGAAFYLMSVIVLLIYIRYKRKTSRLPEGGEDSIN